MTSVLETHGSTTFSLGAGELVRRDVFSRIELRCTRGRIWITVDNSREDIVLEAGEHHEFAGPALMVIEALALADLAFVDEIPDKGFSCE